MTSSADTDLLLFAPQNTRELAARVASLLGIELSNSEEREYENGEHKMRPIRDVRGRDVYVLAQLCGDPRASANDRLMRAMLFVAAIRDAGAARVTLCAPYLPFARKDRRTKAQDPVNIRYVAAMMEAIGLQQIVVVDVHNLAAFECAFRIPTVQLDTSELLAKNIQSLSGPTRWVVASPDVGGIKRAQHMREVLQNTLGTEVGAAFMDKKRSSGVVSGDTLVGEVRNRNVLFVDDIIASGTTMLRAAQASKQAGAGQVHIAATHAVFVPAALDLFNRADGAIDSVIVSNSIALQPDFAHHVGAGLKVLDLAPLLATTIGALHGGKSVSALCGVDP